MNIEEVQIAFKKNKGIYKAYGVDGSQCEIKTTIIDGLEILLIGVANTLRLAGFVKSNSEAMRLIKQGAVKMNEKRIVNPKLMLGLYRNGKVLEFL